MQTYKFTGSKRPHPCDSDTNARTTSPQITKVASPTPPPPTTTAHACPSNNNPSSQLVSTQPKHNFATSNAEPYKSNAAPIRGLPTELLGNSPLRLIIVGHNPSEIAWKRGHYYANPSNWMWRILRDTNLAPVDIISGCNDDFKMPGSIGIGFTDVGSGTPGTDSNQFKTRHFDEWRQPFYDRLRAHMTRASENVEKCSCGKCGAPVVVVFSGKKQFSELFSSPFASRRKNKNTSVNTTSSSTGLNTQDVINTLENDSENRIGIQAARPFQIPIGRQVVLPLGWPLPLDKTEVWVMTSTSGAAAMTKEARYAPWKALSERLENVPWPLNRQASCSCGSLTGKI